MHMINISITIIMFIIDIINIIMMMMLMIICVIITSASVVERRGTLVVHDVRGGLALQQVLV